MMNKGLEVIEAHWLFDASSAQIEVVVHPQSVIHSMVEYHDGSVLAQLGNPDMRTPIAYGLAYPDRLESGVSRLDFLKMGPLDFSAPDYVWFPCLRLAYEALDKGGTAPAVLNAANEVAVEAFLANEIRFMDIPAVIEAVLATSNINAVISIEQLVSVDASARKQAKSIMSVLKGAH
jgi:1-deoxy-D-xylulose-5-phosphate reductoisomerase